MTKETILELKCKKHVKIYKLSQSGLTKKEIAEYLKANLGNIHRVLKDYEANPTKKDFAETVTC